MRSMGREETVDTKYIAQAYDDCCGEKGAFDRKVRELQKLIIPEALARIVEPCHLAADEIDMDPGALDSGEAFERFYSRAYAKLHRLFVGYTGVEMPTDIAGTNAERAFDAVYPGGRGQAFDMARSKGLRHIVEVIRDYVVDEAIAKYFEIEVQKRMDIPAATVLHHVVHLLKDGVKLKRADWS